MRYLEPLQTVAPFGLFTNHIQNRIDQLGSFGIMAFGPIISSTRLPKNEIVGPK
jgi:hypothetical protein